MSANRVLVQAMVITVIATVIISTLCLVFSEDIMRLAGSNQETHKDAVAYFRIIMAGLIFHVLSLVINAAHRGAGNTKIAMRTNLVSNGVNVIFNYLLIGGHFGFPALGVAGAAYATVIGTIFACGMSIYSLFHEDQFICIRLIRKIGFDRRTIRAITSIGSASLFEQLALRVGFMVYAAFVARLGTTEFSAHLIGMHMMSISFSFGDGMSVAAVALVGQNLGAKRPDLARIYGAVCQRIGLLFALGLSMIFLTLNRPIFMLFSQEEPILAYGKMIMTILTVVVFMQIPQVIYSGGLRGAGDTRFVAIVSLISVALIRPVSCYVLCYPAGLGLLGAWISVAFDQFLRFVMTALRFKSSRWTKISI